MKVRTSELTGAALDWAVAKADKRLGRGEVEGAVDRENSWLYVLEDSNEEMHSRLVQCYYSPSTNWAQGDRLIVRAIRDRGEWPISVSHHDRIDGMTFAVAANEIRSYTRSERMRAVGFTRRPSAKSLPSDE